MDEDLQLVSCSDKLPQKRSSSAMSELRMEAEAVKDTQFCENSKSKST